MLGDVGGLAGLLVAALEFSFGFFTPYFFLVSQVKALFHISPGDGRDPAGPAKILAGFKGFELSMYKRFILGLTCGYCPRGRA